MSQSLRQQAPDCWQVKTTSAGSTSCVTSPLCGPLRPDVK
jgi:hypothetical protein